MKTRSIVLFSVYTFVLVTILLWSHSLLMGSLDAIIALTLLGGMVGLGSSRLYEKFEVEKEIGNVVDYIDFAESQAEFENIVIRISELSRKQIDESREQTEIAITRLAKKFRNLVDKINIAVLSSKNTIKQFENGDRGLDLLSIFEKSKLDLDQVVDSRQQAKTELLGKVQNLAKQIIVLKKLADEVQSISTRTNLLALNASIEASRAGKNGRAFTVVANEVRNLSQRSSMTTNQIAIAINDVGESMNDTVINALKVSEQDAARELEAHETINSVLEKIQKLTKVLSKSSDDLCDESIEIRNEIADILVDLQFQDRTSQILSHVGNSLSKFSQDVEQLKEQRVQGIVSRIKMEEVMCELRKGYTTLEQYQIHVGVAVDPTRLDREEIEYF